MNEGSRRPCVTTMSIDIAAGFTHFTIQQQLALELTQDVGGQDPRVKPIPASSCSILPPRAQPEPPSEAIKRKKPGLLHKHHELFFPPSAHYVKPSAAELCSFEPIFELLAHLSGLDFCLCQKREREEPPFRHPPPCSAGAKSGHNLRLQIELIWKLNCNAFTSFSGLHNDFRQISLYSDMR